MPKVPEYPQSPIIQKTYPIPRAVTAYFKAAKKQTKSRINKTVF